LRNEAVTEGYFFSLGHNHIGVILASVAVGLLLPNLVPATQDRIVRILVKSKTQ
jgi:hypothetical protein